MGARFSQESTVAEIQDQYKYLRTINDPRYGEGKLLENNIDGAKVIMKEITITEETQFTKWQKKIETRNLQRCPYIIRIINTYQTQDKVMCSSLYKIFILFEFIPKSLQMAINEQKSDNKHFNEDELYKFIEGAVNVQIQVRKGLSVFQQNKIAHQNIRTQTLSVIGTLQEENLTLKICDTPLLTNLTAFASVSQDFAEHLKGYYLSPILVQAVAQQNYNPNHDPFKSDVFSLGMVMLSTALLQPLDHCIKYSSGEIYDDKIDQCLQNAEQIYSNKVMQIIREMVIMKEDDRPDFVQLMRMYFKEDKNIYGEKVMTSQPAEDQNLYPIPYSNIGEHRSPFENEQNIYDNRFEHHQVQYESNYGVHYDDREPYEGSSPKAQISQPYNHSDEKVSDYDAGQYPLATDDVDQLDQRVSNAPPERAVPESKPDVILGGMVQPANHQTISQHITFQKSQEQSPVRYGENTFNPQQKFHDFSVEPLKLDNFQYQTKYESGQFTSNYVMPSSDHEFKSTQLPPLIPTYTFAQTNPLPTYSQDLVIDHTPIMPAQPAKSEVDLMIERYNRQYNSNIATSSQKQSRNSFNPPLQTELERPNNGPSYTFQSNYMMSQPYQYENKLESELTYKRIEDYKPSQIEDVQVDKYKYLTTNYEPLKLESQTRYSDAFKYQFDQHNQAQETTIKPPTYEPLKYGSSNADITKYQFTRLSNDHKSDYQYEIASTPKNYQISNQTYEIPIVQIDPSKQYTFDQYQGDAEKVKLLTSPQPTTNTYQFTSSTIPEPEKIRSLQPLPQGLMNHGLYQFEKIQNFQAVESVGINDIGSQNGFRFSDREIQNIPPYQSKLTTKASDYFGKVRHSSQYEQITTTNGALNDYRSPYQATHNSQVEYQSTNFREEYGKQEFENGGYYEGYIKNGKLHGVGTLYYANGRPAYEGQWMNDKFEGQGTLYNDHIVDASGVDYRDLNSIGKGWIKYVGGFKDDCRHGFGTIYLSDGDKFEGNFNQDNADGPGTYYKKHQMIPGIWRNNRYQQ